MCPRSEYFSWVIPAVVEVLGQYMFIEYLIIAAKTKTSQWSASYEYSQQVSSKTLNLNP